uniref:Uncharacterized protein n=1 Tax=Rhizophora mucronata TaxID=61149 RepID=A0A2P2K4W6_RHIMU
MDKTMNSKWLILEHALRNCFIVTLSFFP